MNNDISQLSIRKLLSGEANYTIPMYQRNYAWDEGEITQLIQDVIDYLPEGRNYYIGTLVVFERKDGKFEVIDGQQRLTTLSLLSAYLKNEIQDVKLPKGLNLHFDSRPNSQNTLTAIFDNQIDNLNLNKLAESNTAILNGYRLIKRILPQKLAENEIDLQQFSDFLFENVQIMRVKVPKDTDLNHYFEIMNNRGEQLEKHEVLKSRMMEALKDDKESQNFLHLVWEACANMEKYVQMGFSPKQRDAIFEANDWSSFDVNDFEKLLKKVADGTPDRGSEQTLALDEIIRQARGDFKPSKDDESPERFNTVINFPNFLLHVLRVQTEKDVPLDDKRLISTFESILLKGDDVAEKVRKFTFDLLRCKFLYDQYIIKREFIKGTDGWSLKRLSRDQQDKPYYYKNTFGEEDANRRILMLLSAFHVSTPTLVYKHWLNAALHYLFTAEKIILADEYLAHLESVAKAFVFDRFLSANGGLDYFKMIFGNKGACQTTREIVSEEHMKPILETKLSFGKIENNLVFNFLDYLLWVKNKKDPKISDFQFTSRSSVEHFFPQNPSSGEPPENINSFGNLCLINHRENSSFSNRLPNEKAEKVLDKKIKSIKQYMMAKCTLEKDEKKTYGEEKIEAHFNEMKSVLLETLDPGRCQDSQV